MPSVLDRDELNASPLADLHLIANEIGLDGFRRLRKSDLVESIIARQSGEAAPVPEAAAAPDVEAAASTDAPTERAEETGDDDAASNGAGGDDAEDGRRSRRGRRGGRSRSRGRDEAVDGDGGDEEVERGSADVPAVAGAGAARAEGGRRDGGRADGDEPTVEGVVELLPNGSGFLRLSHPEVTEDDVYVSAAQVKRCELVAGDRIAGPVRAPRRSERHPSLVRVTTINGRPADEVAEGTRFDELRATYPTEQLELGGDLVLVDRIAPIGRGSRATVVGESFTGKSELLRRTAAALHAHEGLEVITVLAGTRPEELEDWTSDQLPAPVAIAPLGSAPDAQGQAIEQAIEQGRRVAARGGDAVVIIDALQYVGEGVARRALAAARNLAESGSLTVLAAAPAALGGESTVVRLDPLLSATGRYPAVSPVHSYTMRAELLVGEKEAKRARAERAKNH